MFSGKRLEAGRDKERESSAYFWNVTEPVGQSRSFVWIFTSYSFFPSWHLKPQLQWCMRSKRRNVGASPTYWWKFLNGCLQLTITDCQRSGKVVQYTAAVYRPQTYEPVVDTPLYKTSQKFNWRKKVSENFLKKCRIEVKLNSFLKKWVLFFSAILKGQVK